MTNSSGPITVRLTRATGQQWGFRLHGGKDFNQPLVVLKVSGGSIAETSNLSPGDIIIGINGHDAAQLKHKEAQDLISRSGNTVEFTVQKGGPSVWKPSVTPIGDLSRVGENRVVTKTSLARNQPSSGSFRVGPGVNSVARPFLSTQDGRALVNNQFNSPINLYSDANIAETLSAQAEVLTGSTKVGIVSAPPGSAGAIGVNFKKNEKKYNYEDSEVYKMLKQTENESEEVRLPEERGQREAERQPPPQLTQTISSLRPVRAPEPKPPSADQPAAAPGSTNPNLCAECERLIVGVFVRIQGRSLHVECFKCATCGQSLKNIGYFNINNKLYCDVHAQTVARHNPPAPGLEPFAQLPSASSFSPAAAAPLPSLGGSNVTNIPIAEPDWVNTSYASATLPDLPPVASSTSTSNSIVLPSNDTSSPLLKTNAACADSLITASSTSESTKTIVSGDAQNLFISTGEDNVKPFSYSPVNRPDAYSANIAPQPFHHSPTAPSHVTAPSKLIQESSFMEKRSFSSSSETVTKSSPGSKFVWPPLQSNDDPVMLGSSDGTVIPIQHQPLIPPSPAVNQSSSFSQSSSSMNQQSSSLLTGAPQYQSPLPSSFGSPSTSLYQNQPLAQPYKPVVPPKPRGPQQQQQQTPYKPLSTLLAPANKPFVASPPVQPPFASMPAPPPPSGPATPSGLGSALGNSLNLKRGQNVSRGILPNRGRGVLTQPGPRIAICGACNRQIRGPFITAGGSKFYCPEHFKCATQNCSRALIDIGFVEEKGQLFCEFCWESYLAPVCNKCNKRIKNECLNALNAQWHPQCFCCSHCRVCFGNNPFYIEDGAPFCQQDWNELFTTKCFGCGFPIEAGDRWVEALNQSYHSQCFNCSACKKNLEGTSFIAKAGRPFCKSHAK